MKVFDLGQIKSRENLRDPRAVWRKRGKTRLLQSNDFFSLIGLTRVKGFANALR